ncbi:hypothetical protein M9H77_17565 [Catharanthus roseus]|uniref:Uncharacterized protein n=1 Tax=Catharanthus roseus TaxID=4058 RepID=A0ACC0B4Y5_CATRO|nr:hypothetical protein M9H77_17565 [Catharanthus roseus]
MIQELALQVIGDQEEDFKRSKTVLWSIMPVEESKEANLGSLVASKIKGMIFLEPTITADGSIDEYSVVLDPSCYGFGNLDDTSLVELNIVGFAFEFDKNTPQHVCTITSIRGRRHTMELRGKAKVLEETNFMLWRFDNEFFFKPISLLPCVFLQRVKIFLRIECLLCGFGSGLYG